MALRSLNQRDLQPEIMDQPDLSPEHHQQALDGLARVNVLSRTGAGLWRPIRELALRNNLRVLTVLDVAAGGGDVALDLVRRAAEEGCTLHVVGYDISPTAVTQAQRRIAAVSLPHGSSISFECRDIFTIEPRRQFDVVMSSLFLHHLDEPQALELLRRMAAMSRRSVVISDLVRSTVGYWLAHLVCRVVTRSAVVHYDGPQSVAGAFTQAEAHRLAEQAGLSGASLRSIWPFRFLLSWEHSS